MLKRRLQSTNSNSLATLLAIKPQVYYLNRLHCPLHTSTQHPYPFRTSQSILTQSVSTCSAESQEHSLAVCSCTSHRGERLLQWGLPCHGSIAGREQTTWKATLIEQGLQLNKKSLTVCNFGRIYLHALTYTTRFSARLHMCRYTSNIFSNTSHNH